MRVHNTVPLDTTPQSTLRSCSTCQAYGLSDVRIADVLHEALAFLQHIQPCVCQQEHIVNLTRVHGELLAGALNGHIPISRRVLPDAVSLNTRRLLQMWDCYGLLSSKVILSVRP